MKCNNILCKRHLTNGECVKLLGEECQYEQLKAQIEKMKCCYNCKRDYSNAETEEEEVICQNCIDNCNWELKE